jgi:hypothetical protein
MTKWLGIGLVALAVGISAAALAWRSYTPPPQASTVAAAAPVADAPSSRGIFPKVLNH